MTPPKEIQEHIAAICWYMREANLARIEILEDTMSMQPKISEAKAMRESMAEAMVRIAVGEIGVVEIGSSNCGPRVNQYKAATWLDPQKPWPWCAAFVCWVVRAALEATGTKETATFVRPQTAGAWDLENWSLAQDNTTWTRKRPKGDVKPGDIVIYTFSHCGIAVTAPDKAGNLYVVEGNTDGEGSRDGGGVLRKVRNVVKIRSRIRFRV